MQKKDISIKNITIASIIRHTIKPIDYTYSKVYDKKEETLDEKILSNINLEEGEELICSTVISDLIWSVLTSRRIITLEGLRKREHSLKGLKIRDIGDFKGYSKQKYTKGVLHFDDEKLIPFFIETGKASMIMVYGTNTATQLLNGK